VNEFSVVLQAVLPVFCLAGAGILLRRLNWLTEEADQSLLRVTINLLVPCFILHHVIGNQALEQLSNVAIPPLIGFGTVAMGLLLGLAIRGLAGLAQDQPAGRTFAFSQAIYNYGYVPLPLALSLFDRPTVGVLVVHNVGVEIALWTLGGLVLGERGGSLWKRIFTPPVFAILFALGLNFVGGRSLVPDFLATGFKYLGDCAIPMGLLLTGAIVADHLSEFHSESGWRVMGVACLSRLLVLPLAFLLLAKFLPVSLELKRVLVLQAAMPAAVFAIIMARHYKGDTPTALRVVVATSVVSFVTIPLWIRWGMKFVGL
jgi:predicted permease